LDKKWIVRIIGYVVLMIGGTFLKVPFDVQQVVRMTLLLIGYEIISSEN